MMLNVNAQQIDWAKVTALVMHKQGLTHLVITQADLAAMPQGHTLLGQTEADGNTLHLMLVDADAAALLQQGNPEGAFN